MSDYYFCCCRRTNQPKEGKDSCRPNGEWGRGVDTSRKQKALCLWKWALSYYQPGARFSLLLFLWATAFPGYQLRWGWAHLLAMWSRPGQSAFLIPKFTLTGPRDEHLISIRIIILYPGISAGALERVTPSLFARDAKLISHNDGAAGSHFATPWGEPARDGIPQREMQHWGVRVRVREGGRGRERHRETETEKDHWHFNNWPQLYWSDLTICGLFSTFFA